MNRASKATLRAGAGLANAFADPTLKASKTFVTYFMPVGGQGFASELGSEGRQKKRVRAYPSPDPPRIHALER